MAIYINYVFGLITGTNTQTAVAFPDVPAERVNLQGYADNKESFFIGNIDHVWWEVRPGLETGWFEIDNLNKLQFYSISGSAERLIYWIQR